MTRRRLLPSLPPEVFAARLRAVWISRLFFTAMVLGTAISAHIRAGGLTPVASTLYATCVAMFGVSACYGFVMLRTRIGPTFGVLQVLVDTAVVSLLVWVGGVAPSGYSFLFFINVLYAAYLLSWTGALGAAAVSAASFVGLLLFSRSGHLPPFDPNQPLTLSLNETIWQGTSNVFGLGLIAAMAGYLVELMGRSEAAVREERDALRELRTRVLDNIDSGVITVNQGGIVTSFNRAAQHITGRSQAAVVGASVDALFPEVKARLAHREVATRWDQSWDKEGGEQLWLLFRSSPLLRKDGTFSGHVIIFEDQTLVRSMEEKLRRDAELAAVGRLAAGIAHEVRNPLTSISGSIQILKAGGNLTGEDAHLMNIVLDETDRLNKLITDFLQFVRPRPLHLRELHLHALIQDTVYAVKRDPRFGGKVEIALELGARAPLRGDADQLRQVLWNLLLNSAAAMADGGRITITTRDALSPNGVPVVEWEVVDTGEGIPQDVMERIFDPFFSTRTTGTGLGLPTVERIVGAHDGRIRVESKVGEGTRFVIQLPAPGISRGVATPEGIDVTAEVA